MPSQGGYKPPAKPGWVTARTNTAKADAWPADPPSHSRTADETTGAESDGGEQGLETAEKLVQLPLTPGRWYVEVIEAPDGQLVARVCGAGQLAGGEQRMGRRGYMPDEGGAPPEVDEDGKECESSFQSDAGFERNLPDSGTRNRPFVHTLGDHRCMRVAYHDNAVEVIARTIRHGHPHDGSDHDLAVDEDARAIVRQLAERGFEVVPAGSSEHIDLDAIRKEEWGKQQNLYHRLTAAEARVTELKGERQAILDCINLYGDETLHGALNDAGLLLGRGPAGSSQVPGQRDTSKGIGPRAGGCSADGEAAGLVNPSPAVTGKEVLAAAVRGARDKGEQLAVFGWWQEHVVPGQREVWVVSKWIWGGGGDDDREIVSVHPTEAAAEAAALDADYRIDRAALSRPKAPDG